MTSLPKRAQSMWGWMLRLRIDQLQNAYKAARAAPDADREDIERRWKKLESDVAAGRSSFIEEDEDGQVIYDHGDAIGEDIAGVEETLRIVREAFTISLHHLWERELNKRLKTKHYDEPKVFTYLKADGLHPDEAKLTALRLACNVAKHSAGNSADDLYLIRPDLFDIAEMRKHGEPPSQEHLRISDHTLTEFFAAVRASGPQR